MFAALLPIAASVGAPLIEKILTRRIGAGSARLVTDVATKIAEQLGIGVGELETHARDYPEEVRDAIETVEPMVPELIELYAKGLDYQMATLEAETTGPAWKSAWRPLMMYVLGFLWLWHFFLAYLVHALSGLALPPGDGGLLFQLTGLYMALYMGGHTLKDIMAKWAGKVSR